MSLYVLLGLNVSYLDLQEWLMLLRMKSNNYSRLGREIDYIVVEEGDVLLEGSQED